MPKDPKKLLLVILFAASGALTIQANACVRGCISASLHHKYMDVKKKKSLLTAVKKMIANQPLPLRTDEPVLHELAVSNALKNMLPKKDFKHITSDHPAQTIISETNNHFIVKQLFVANSSDYFMIYDRDYSLTVNKKTAEIQFYQYGSIIKDRHLWIYSSEPNEKNSVALVSKILDDKRPLCKGNDYSQEPKSIDIVDLDVSKMTKGGCSH